MITKKTKNFKKKKKKGNNLEMIAKSIKYVKEHQCINDQTNITIEQYTNGNTTCWYWNFEGNLHGIKYCPYCGKNLYEKKNEDLETVEELKQIREKQIAKKPIEQIKLSGLDKGGKCPLCNKYINNWKHWMYCECGQKIDWSDAN